MPDKNVQMPDGRVVAFPASMSDADISGILARDYIKNNPPGMPKRPDAIRDTPTPSSSGLFEQMPRTGSFDLGPSKVGAKVAEKTVGDVTGGVGDIAEGNIARGAHRVISGAGTIAAPIVLPAAAAAAPVATALGLVGGGVGAAGGKIIATEAGATPDQADLAGDVGGFIGGGLGPKADPLASKLRGPVASALDFASDVVDPDITGVISPRLAHAQRYVGKMADAIRPSAKEPVFYDRPAGPFAGVEGEYIDTPPAATPQRPGAPVIVPEINPRQLPASASVASNLPYRQGPNSVVPEIVGPTNPNVLAGNKGVIVRPRLQLTGEVPTEFPIAPSAPAPGDVIKAPAGSPTGRADYLEDQAIREGMSNDLYRQAQAGGREVRAEFEAGHSMDKPKYLRQAEAEAQQIMNEAQQRAQQHVQETIDKFNSPVTGKNGISRSPLAEQSAAKFQPTTTGPVDLETALRQSITEAQAAKAAKQPIRVDFDENGNIADADGRHRVIEALQRGDKTIAVRTKLADGSVQTLNIDPAKVAEKMGVTAESLKATDEQQAPFINWKVRRR